MATIINGFEMAWADVEISVSGKSQPLIGVTGIEYGVKREHNNVIAKGGEAVAMYRGSKQPDGCKLTLLQSEFEAWQKSLPAGKDLTDLLAFNIDIAYAPEDAPRIMDRLVGVRVSSWKKVTGQDKKNMEIELDLMVLKVQLNIA